MSDLSAGGVVEPGTDAGESVAELGTPTDDVAEPVSSEASEEAQTFTVEIGGKEETLTLDELRNGYLRQSDYTRKTQELAAQRQQVARAEALVSALQEDPQGTLEALREAYGVEFGTGEPLDPEEARIAALEKQVQLVQERETRAQIGSELSDLHSQYGDFDDDALLRHAIEHQIPNLKAAFESYHYQTVRAELDKVQAERKQAADRAAEEAKRGASFIEGGSSQAAGSVSTNTPKVKSIAEAFKLAQEMASA